MPPPHVHSAGHLTVLFSICGHTGPRSLPRESGMNRAAGVLYIVPLPCNTNDVGAADVDFVRCAALSAFSNTAFIVCLITCTGERCH